WAPDREFDHSIFRFRLSAENFSQGSTSDGTFLWKLWFPGRSICGLGVGTANRLCRVIDLLHCTREIIQGPLPFDVHEKHLRLIKKEMVMQSGNAKTIVDRSAHCRVHLIFEQNSIAHHHCIGVDALGERGPCAEAHERRHWPAADRDLHVGSGESDSIDALL